MSKPAASGPGNAQFLFWILIALGLAGAGVWLHGEAGKEREKLDRYKKDYREMADRMRRPIEAHLKAAKGGGAKSAGEDLLTFLSRKANGAQIPPSLFAIQRNESKVGPWREQTFTVNLRGSKETPLQRAPVADFLRLVETERPAVRVRTLNLMFAGNDLATAVLTFAFFELDK